MRVEPEVAEVGVRVVNAPHLHEALPEPKGCASVLSASSAGSSVTPLCVPEGEVLPGERVIRNGDLGRHHSCLFCNLPVLMEV